MFTVRHVGQLVVVVAVSMSAFAADQLHKEFRYTVGPKASVYINNQYGPVTIKPSGNSQILASAVLQSDKVKVEEGRNGDRIELKSQLQPGATPDNGRVDFEVLVPSDANITVHSGTGPLHVEQMQADLSVEADTAPVDVRDVSNAHVHINTLNGAVTLSNIRNGHVEISSVGGEVTLNSVTGPFVAVTSTTGKIHYNGDFGVGGDYKLSSHSGDIEAIVPAEASVNVTARSVRGEVQNDFPLRLKHQLSSLPDKGRSFMGTAGKATSSVLLRTFSGKIRLKQR